MTEFDCVACGESVTADDSDEAARCGSCGTKYAPDDVAGWDKPTLEESPVLDDEEIAAATVGEPVDDDATASVTTTENGVEVDIEVTVRIRGTDDIAR